LAERWDGRRWTIQALPKVGNGGLSGVACTSTRACIAVGNLSPGLIALSWNGRRWAIQKNQATQDEAGVACASASA
jgi:hypothetical protein